MDLTALEPHSGLLVAAVAADAVFGDPVYRWHPVRLIGGTLAAFEQLLRRGGFDGYGGGVALGGALAALWVGGLSVIVALAGMAHPLLPVVAHTVLLYTLLAFGDLLRHGAAVERAAASGDVVAARAAAARLVGRDADRMDGPACRRAAIESLAENLTDGFLAPLFWYALGGLPGIVLFKVVSTMDSMVGFKTERHLRFGWFGARADDIMNLVPARLTWILIAGAAAIIPGCSSAKAIHVGWRQHAVVPGPNSGWSEAAMAGAIQRLLVGPMWEDGRLVTETWLGHPSDPPAASHEDFKKAAVIGCVSAAMGSCLAAWACL